MSFTPVVPLGGFAGWAFLKRTLPAQQAAFVASPEVKRDEDHFRDKIGKVTSAEELVSDRRLLKVALGAFGLDDDINNRFFLRKVLEDGTTSDRALSNRLADKQYRAFSQAFGFGDGGVPNTQTAGFATTLLSAYETRRFEKAVGTQSSSLRLALNAEREVAALAKTGSSDASKWYTVMGSAPLRAVFQTAFGLPSSFASIDIDQQLGVFRSKAEQVFGSSAFAQFADPAKVDALLRRYLALSDQGVSRSQQGSGAGALQLLRPSGSGGAAAGLLQILR